MADEVFSWSPRTNAPQGATRFAVLQAQFGDGYAQRAEDGINNLADTWPLTFAGRAAYVLPIKQFLDRHKGARSFLWTPPLGVQGRYATPQGYALVPAGAGLYTLTVTLEQVFHP